MTALFISLSGLIPNPPEEMGAQTSFQETLTSFFIWHVWKIKAKSVFLYPFYNNNNNNNALSH